MSFSIQTAATFSYLISGLFFILLALYTHIRLRHTFFSTALIVACLLSAIWSGSLIINKGNTQINWMLLLELCRDGSWYHFLITCVYHNTASKQRWLYGFHGVWLAALFSMLAQQLLPYSLSLPFLEQSNVGFILLTPIVGLILIEQAYRNTSEHLIGSLRHIFFGAGCLFAYDLYVYINSLMADNEDVSLWLSRGFIMLFITFLIYWGINHFPANRRQVQMSRKAVFYTTSLTISGSLFIGLAIGSQFIRSYGGNWGDMIRLVFLFIGGLTTLTLLSSKDLRSHLRVLINKHLFSHKYDYREEWLTLINTLTDQDNADIYKQSVKAMMQIIDAQGGSLWMQESDYEKRFLPMAEIELPFQQTDVISQNESLINYLSTSDKPIVLIQELKKRPEAYNQLTLPLALQHNDLWGIVPLNMNGQLTGFICLLTPSLPLNPSWEDFDLLKTASLQIASFLAVEQSSHQLSESKQFEAYSKFTAFIMHDLKNLVAQQSLVVKNAAKHKDNPVFINDAIDTIDNSVKRMTRLLAQLKQQHERDSVSMVCVNDALQDAVQKCQDRTPKPTFTNTTSRLFVKSSADQLAMVFNHLIRNAQDATKTNGTVDINLNLQENIAIIEVKDNGHGMSEHFIRERLFKPFDTTKDSKGMGIGAYQAREFIHQAGGSLSVLSQEGEGSTFTIKLPVTCQ